MHGNQTYAAVPASAPIRTTGWAFVVGGLTTASIGFYMGVVNVSATTAVLLACAGGIVAGMILSRGMAPPRRGRHRRTRPPRGPFATTADMRRARDELLLARKAHAQRLREKSDLRQRLVTLRAKMEEVGLAAYQPRIESIESALRTVARQLDVLGRLRDGYDRSITMIDIELEAGIAVSEMDDDVGTTMISAMRELKALEATQAELARQLEANVEVELLLR